MMNNTMRLCCLSTLRASHGLGSSLQHRSLHVSSCVRVTYDPNDPRLRRVSVPSHGAVYDVGYLDTGPVGGSTVLAVHGAPGGANDFDVLTDRLVDNGIRIIVPNLPGNGVTRRTGKSTFSYTMEHRAEFVSNFLDAIRLSCVDVALGHSIGGPVVIDLAATTAKTKAIALFNSVGHIMHRGVKPHWLVRTYFGSTRLPLLGPLLKLPLVQIYQRRGFKVDDLYTLLSSLAIAAQLNFMRVKRSSERVSQKGLPVYSATCQNDRIVEWDRTVKVALLAGADSATVSYYDQDERLTQGPGIEENLPSRTLVFERGGHFCHKSHADIVFKGLIDLIRHVHH